MDFEILGYRPQDKTNIEKSINKLLPYFEPDRFVLVGGPVIRYHIISRGNKYLDRSSSDLDFKIEDYSVLSPKVTKDFLIYHNHVYKKVPHDKYFYDRFYVVLVDPETKVKIDLFDYVPYVPHEQSKVNFSGHQIYIRNLEDQLVTSIKEGSRILDNMNQDPKKFADIEMMLAVADINKAEKYWDESYQKYTGMSMMDTWHKMLEKRTANPELIVDKAEKRKDKKPYHCEYCEDINGITVTPMDAVFKVLGY